MTINGASQTVAASVEEPVRVSPAPPERPSMHYAGLREEGLALIRKLAAQTWTDHNPHDPGITALEAFSYAMTELGFRVQLDMADLLRSGALRRAADLIPVQRVLPSAPITPDDLRALLLDHPLVGNAWITLDTEAEIGFFQDPGNDPPFTYSGAYGFQVQAGPPDPASYTLEADIGYPQDDEAAPLVAGASVDAATLVNPSGGVWQPGAEPRTFDGILRVMHSLSGGSGVLEVPVVLTLMDTPQAGHLTEVLSEARAALEATGADSLVQRYAARVRAQTPAVRVSPKGPFETMLEFEERDWNRNTFDLALDTGTQIYALDIALPFWDEEEVSPIRDGASVDSVAMIDLGGTFWVAQEEPQTYFGRLRVETSAQPTELWVLLRIVDDLANPVTETVHILAAAQPLLETTGADSLVGRFVERVRAVEGAVTQVQRYLNGWRNLCEEPVRLSSARVQEIGVRARIQVTGSTDLEALLADIVLAIEQLLSPPLQFLSLQQMGELGHSVETAFDGPLLRHGFLDPQDRQGNVTIANIYVSDVLRLIMQQRGGSGDDVVAQENPTGRDIVAVTDLALSNYVNNRLITGDAADCLRLVESERYQPRLSLAKCRIVFVRNEIAVDYDLGRVDFLADEKRRASLSTVLPTDPAPPAPAGERLPVDEYYPFQNDLPRAYGVGADGLPDSASPERKARARQYGGYLMLFEQLLADFAAQLGNINRFFSADPDETSTYFTQPLFELAGVGQLIRGAPAQDGPDWQTWIENPANPHALALHDAVEDRDRFLDRRNRMLDHLLARQGEQSVAWGQELHRWARKELTDGGVSPADLPARIDDRRRDVNARLIGHKATFVAELPELNTAKQQAFGDPLKRCPELLQLDRSASGYRWVLAPDGVPMLRASEVVSTEASSRFAAEEAVLLASRADYYQGDSVAGGGWIFRLRDGDRMLADSIQTFSTEAQAEAAMNSAAARFAALRLAESATPLERRIAHLTGIRVRTRRPVIVPVDAYFEIHEEVGGDSVAELRWRLWEEPSFAGQILLSSVSGFRGAGTSAEEQARASIDQVLRHGLDEWNYVLMEPGPEMYHFALQDPAGRRIASSNLPLAGVAEAREQIAYLADRLYGLYSAESVHLVEHLALRPRLVGDPFLSLPSEGGGRDLDPYSQRFSLVLPSGYWRDFGDEAETPALEPAPPHRFRDREFRRHAEQVVRQACPAHVTPTVYWVHRERTGSASSEASFDEFERRHVHWLETLLIPGIATEEVTAARAALVACLNAIAND